MRHRTTSQALIILLAVSVFGGCDAPHSPDGAVCTPQMQNYAEQHQIQHGHEDLSTELECISWQCAAEAEVWRASCPVVEGSTQIDRSLCYSALSDITACASQWCVSEWQSPESVMMAYTAEYYSAVCGL